MGTIGKTIGRNIAYLRKQKGLTQKQLASILHDEYGRDVAAGAITSYEQGTREPRIGTIIAIAEYFDTTPDFILGVTKGTTPGIASINEMTGLSDASIKTLTLLKLTATQDVEAARACKGINRALSREKAKEFFVVLEQYTDGWSIQNYADMLVSIGPLGDHPMDISAEEAYQTAEGQSKMLVYNALNALLEDISIDPETAADEREFYETMYDGVE